MNLEQIEQTQENINHQLSKVLEELRAVVNFIAGNELAVLGDKMKEENNRNHVNGILNSIAYTQQEGNALIYEINNQLSKLSDSTWQREEIVEGQDMSAVCH